MHMLGIIRKMLQQIMIVKVQLMRTMHHGRLHYLYQRWNRVTGQWFWPVCDPVLSIYTVTPSRKINIRSFGDGSVPITTLLVYLFQLVPIIIVCFLSFYSFLYL